MKKRLIAIFIALWALTSCGTSYYYAEFIYPSRVYVPADLYKVGIINVSATPKSAAPIYANGDLFDQAPGMPLRTSEKVVTAIMNENEFMNRYEMLRIPVDSAANLFSILEGKRELTEVQADSICLWELVDGLIMLDDVEMSVHAQKGSVEMITTTDEYGNMVRVPEFKVSTQIRLTAQWRFYDYVNKVFLDTFKEDYDFDLSQVLYSEQEAMKLNPREISTMELATIAAIDYYSRIAPYWAEDYRMYYQTGNSEMYRIANDLEYDGDWEKAASAWNKLTDEPSEKLAYRSRFNMAVASEMLGHPRLGKEWLQKAEEIKETKDSQKYMEQLERQIVLFDVVNLQLGLDQD